MYTLSKAVTIIIVLSVCTYAVQCASILENSSDLWRGWLLMEDEVPSQQNSPLTRRITPKSVFIAPSNIHCTDGFRHDGKDCVRIVKVDELAQLDFLLQKINAIYPGSSSENNESTAVVEQQEFNKEDTSGPFQLSIPFGNNNDDNKPMITNANDVLTIDDVTKANETLHDVISQLPTTTEVTYEYSTDESFLFPQVQEISNINIDISSLSSNMTKIENATQVFNNVYPTITDTIESTTAKLIENHTNSYYDDSSTTIPSVTENNYNCFGESCDINITNYNTEQTINLQQLNTTNVSATSTTNQLLSDKPLISIFANGINYTLDTVVPIMSTDSNVQTTEVYEKDSKIITNAVKANFIQVTPTNSIESIIINSTESVINATESVISSSWLENKTISLEKETTALENKTTSTEDNIMSLEKITTSLENVTSSLENITINPNIRENITTEIVKNVTEKYETEMPIKLVFSSPYKNNEFASKKSEIKFPIDKEKEIEKEEWILNDEESLTKNEKRVVNNYSNDNINDNNKNNYNNKENNDNNNDSNNSKNSNIKNSNSSNISFYEKLPTFEKKNKCTSNYEYNSDCNNNNNNNNNSNLVIETNSNIFNHSFQSKPNAYIRFPEIPSKSSTSYIRFPTHRLPTASSYIRESYVVNDDNNDDTNSNFNSNKNNNEYWSPDRGQLWSAWNPPRPQMVRIWPENNYPVTNYNTRHQSSSQSQLQWFNNKFFRSK